MNTKRLERFHSLFALTVCSLLGLQAGAQTTLFDSDASNSQNYRIPSIVQLNNGDYLAFSDLRSGNDIGQGEITLLSKTYSKSAESWGSESTVMEGGKDVDGNAESGYGYGDAASVADRESQNVLAFTASGTIGAGSSSVNNPIRIVKHTSNDNGATWSHSDVTKYFYKTLLNSKWKFLFFSSGRICQSRIIKKGSYYRIYAALAAALTSGSYGTVVVYSDNFGSTWSVLGNASSSPISGANESKLEELPNGNVLLSSRMASTTGRGYNIYKYSGTDYSSGAWGTESTSTTLFNSANSCNGEILVVPAIGSDNKYAYVALQSTVASSSRQYVSIYYKPLSATTDFDEASDFTSGWTQYQVSNTSGSQGSAYSTMILDSDGNIPFYWEDGGIDPTSKRWWYFDMLYRKYTLSDITGGSYTFSAALQANAALLGKTKSSDDTGDDSGDDTDEGSVNGGASETDSNLLPVTASDGSVGSESKSGLTISLNTNTCHALYASKATSVGTFAGYMRHDNAPIQLLTSNNSTLISTGTGLFSDIDNDMYTATDNTSSYVDGALSVWNYKNNSSTIYLAVIAPKGYTISRYQIVASAFTGDFSNYSSGNFTDGSVTLTEYTYDSDGNTTDGESTTISSGTVWDVTKTATKQNVIYFRVDCGSSSTQYHIDLNSFKITFDIDDPFTATLPTSDNSDEIHTGVLNLGTFSQNAKSIWSFNSTGVADGQTVKVTKEGDDTQLSHTTVDSEYRYTVSEDGTYYVEAPTKFRITAATFHFYGGEYKVSVFDHDGTTVSGSAMLSSDNTKAELSVTGFNNDAVKFKISDYVSAATFTVDLTIMPLDGYLTSIDAAYKNAKGDIEVYTQGDFTDFKLNDGATTTIVIPSTGSTAESYEVVFRNATNDNQTSWYGTAKGNGLCNYYLVGSPYEVSHSTSNVPYDKTCAEQSGTVQLYSSNIREVMPVDANGVITTGAGKQFVDIAFSKTDASFADLKLASGAEKTVYLYSADRPVWNIKNTDHVVYRYYTATVAVKKAQDVPVVAVKELYTSSFKGANNKNTSIAGDTGEDTAHTFYGVTVTAVDADSKAASEGFLTSTQIIDAIKAELAKDTYSGKVYSDDVCRTILYVDLSGVSTLSDKGDWDAFNESTADNCLYFMPKSVTAAGKANTLHNILSGTTDKAFESAGGDVRIYDKQPFFTPYAFKTGTHYVIYSREISGTSVAQAKEASIVMPFDIDMNEDGHPMTSSDAANETLTFCNLMSAEKREGSNTYVITTKKLTSTAAAYTPYHVCYVPADGCDDPFSLKIMNAQFKVTPTDDDAMTVTPDGATFTGHGSMNGATIDKTKGIYYFNKNYYWSSLTLADKYKVVNQTPFRAYYTTTQTLAGVKAMAVDFSDTYDATTGIRMKETSGTAIKMLLGKGFITVTADSDAALRIMDVSGRAIANGEMNAGESKTVRLCSGIYIVNGRKVIVR